MATRTQDKLPHTMVIRDPEQLRALSDPLRIRILERICDEPKTTKQVADELGESPTRLYHHVDALEKAGLIRLVSTKPKRGTLEKYYGAVAHQFRAEVSLGDPTESGETTDLGELGARLLDSAAADLRRRSRPLAEEDDGLFAKVRLRTNRKSVVRLRKRLEKILTEFGQSDGNEGDEEEYFLTIALYPEEE
jgi:DNA-binding transcriptional ArsR family regulator